MKLYNNEITRRLVESSCIRPFINESGVLCRCGSCYACKQKNNLDWSFRFDCENNSSYVACKLGCTLTYDNLHLPVLDVNTHKVYQLSEVDGFDLSKLPSNLVPVLFIKHYQMFINKLRERIKYRFENLFIRYFVSCEYGGANYRPHYHIAIWVCIIDESQPVYLVLNRDKHKVVQNRILIRPSDYESIIQKGYIENWILGSEIFLSEDESETDNHPLSPSRCLHRVPDLWPYAESRLKYDEKTQSLKWKCVSVEVLGDSYGAYLGGYLAKEDLKKLAPGSVFVPEQKHCSQTTVINFNGKQFEFGCIGFKWCETNKEFYLNNLCSCQIDKKYCFLSRNYIDDKGKLHTVSIPRSFRRYYYKIYSGFSELDWSRLTKIMKSFIKGFLPDYVEEKRLDYSKANIRYIQCGSGYMVERDFSLPTFFHDSEKYKYNKVFALFPYSEVYKRRLYQYWYYKYTHSVRFSQSFYYSVESESLYKPLSDKLEFLGEYYPSCGFIHFNSGSFSSTISELYDQKLQKYLSLVNRVLNKSSSKVERNLQKVKHRLNTDLLNLKERLYTNLHLSLTDDKFNAVGLALNSLKLSKHERKEYFEKIVSCYEDRNNRPCPQILCPF